MRTSGTIVEMNPAKGMFIVQTADGRHSLWTLYSRVQLAVGDPIEGNLAETGSEWLIQSKTRVSFEWFGETGATTLEECRRPMWA